MGLCKRKERDFGYSLFPSNRQVIHDDAGRPTASKQTEEN